eukprot:XP_011663431.1 PREDICTED: farnesyl pyrophosphate synthase [Strongylocentrotus purpuratus]
MQCRLPLLYNRLVLTVIPAYHATKVRAHTKVIQGQRTRYSTQFSQVSNLCGKNSSFSPGTSLRSTTPLRSLVLGHTLSCPFKQEPSTEHPWYISDMSSTSSAQDPQTFEKVFHELVDELTDDAANPEVIDAAAWFKEMLVYTVPGGKRNRGLTVVNAFRQLANSVQNTEDNIHTAMVLGWCVEWLQAYFLIADDMMDQSKTRRGQPCWYKKDGVGNVAINDSFYVEACIYKLLKRYIGHQPYYVQVMELFHETTYQTIMGQSLDLLTSPENDRDLNRFTEQRYAAIVKWKTAFYSFYLPEALAMHMVGISDAKSHTNAKTILLQMGHFFQVQDDYLDCYGEPEVIGKIGTDIEENKCGWLVVQALQRVTPDQREILEANYGIDDSEKVAKVKDLYATLDLESVYRSYEESSYNDLMDTINSHSETLPKDIFVAFAKRIYKRNK